MEGEAEVGGAKIAKGALKTTKIDDSRSKAVSRGESMFRMTYGVNGWEDAKVDLHGLDPRSGGAKKFLKGTHPFSAYHR